MSDESNFTSDEIWETGIDCESNYGDSKNIVTSKKVLSNSLNRGTVY